MIYLPFREDARIVHMHGCEPAPVVLRTMWHQGPGAFHIAAAVPNTCLYRCFKEVVACHCFHLRPKPNHYLEWLQTTRCKFRDFCTLVSGSSR